MTNELPTLYQQSITKTKYARWDNDLGRRETWRETVDRFMGFFQIHLEGTYGDGKGFTPEEYNELFEAIYNLEVSPSMRAMMTAGPALERDHVAAYNCSFLNMDRIKAFSEILYILCCGTGVGFSVERQHVGKLPEVPDELHPSPTTIVVPDSKIGWATSFHELISLLYAGKIPHIDPSKIRPAGSPLKTFGGRASGPGPLMDLFNYTIAVFQKARGRRLDSVEVHGIVCKIGDIVVVGGVRRSALISLFNPSDERMLNAKTGQFPPHFHLANNSAAWTEKPDAARFLKKWLALVESNSGEPGIFNRDAAKRKLESIGRDPDHEFGTNPCGEIVLRDRQFCNLTEVTVREADTLETLRRKVRLATILGTIQSTFTDFKYLGKGWKENCEEERLLGVSFTGIMDNAMMSGRSVKQSSLEYTLQELRKEARRTNDEWADRLGIARSAAITTGKPSGNNSQRLDTASGIHDRFSPFYVRRTRMNKSDPVAQLLAFMGVPHEDEIYHPDSTWVFSWPIKSPEDAAVGSTALEKLNLVNTYNKFWCDHNQSVTINVRDNEWMEVGAWVHRNFDDVVGMTFLPSDEHIYQQAPYEACDQVAYEALLEEMPESIDWDLLSEFEHSDHTEGAKELACVSGSCETV
jgi:ribonucleoside-triphosphate reductase (thioredoxin)